MKKPKQQWLQGWMRHKLRENEIRSWTLECLEGKIPDEIPAPDSYWFIGETLITRWTESGSGKYIVAAWRKRGGGMCSHVRVWSIIDINDGVAEDMFTVVAEDLSSIFIKETE